MAQPVLSLDDLPLPRRVAIAELLGEALAAARRLAALYAAFEASAELAGLRRGLGELARAKAADVAALESLARTLGLDAEASASSGLPHVEAGAVGRAQAFTRAFEAERALDGAYREMLPLLIPGHPLDVRVAGLAAEAARHRGRLRDLYLGYS